MSQTSTQQCSSSSCTMTPLQILKHETELILQLVETCNHQTGQHPTHLKAVTLLSKFGWEVISAFALIKNSMRELLPPGGFAFEWIPVDI